MKKVGLLWVGLALLLAVPAVFAQARQIRNERRPAVTAAVTPTAPLAQPNYQYFSILDGTPKGLWLHHDTEVGTGKPIDVYVFAIELQVLNSDGNFEPEGLIIDNFYTAKAVEPTRAFNPHNARDCKIWNEYVLNEIATRNLTDPTWPYVEFTSALGARTVQTNEDGQVWWSDDIECWGSQDRFAPF
jgi:hypothetical protein